MLCNPPIYRVPQRPGDNAGRSKNPPWESQPTGNLDDRVGVHGDGVTLHHNDRIKGVGFGSEPRKKLASLGRLKRAETEPSSRVAADDEVNRATAQVAETVEQDHRASDPAVLANPFSRTCHQDPFAATPLPLELFEDHSALRSAFFDGRNSVYLRAKMRAEATQIPVRRLQQSE